MLQSHPATAVNRATIALQAGLQSNTGAARRPAGFGRNDRVADLQHGSDDSKSYSRDDANRISQQTDQLYATRTQVYGYDTLDRLTNTTRNTTSEAYQYDANGNRSKLTVGSANTSNTIDTAAAIAGMAATKTMSGEARQIFGRHGLRTQHRKSKTFASGAAKAATGAVVVRDEVRLPNTRHFKIHHARQAVQEASPSEQERARRVLAGRLQEARQILGNTSKNVGT